VGFRYLKVFLSESQLYLTGWLAILPIAGNFYRRTVWQIIMYVRIWVCWHVPGSFPYLCACSSTHTSAVQFSLARSLLLVLMTVT